MVAEAGKLPGRFLLALALLDRCKETGGAGRRDT